MTCDEVRELITGMVDDELGAAERAALGEHFKSCSRCRFLLAQEKNLKKAVFSAGEDLRASSALRQRLANDPRIINRADHRRREPFAKSYYPIVRGTLIAALLILVVVPSLLLTRRSSLPAMATTTVESYQQIVSTDDLQIKTQDLTLLAERLARTVNGRFRPMAYDFSMMHIRPVGGTLLNINRREVLVIRYAGADLPILCYTWVGTEGDAPASAAIFHDPQKRLNFYAFSLGNVNAVLHRENDVICILVSPMAMTDLVDLAKSKANPHKHL